MSEFEFTDRYGGSPPNPETMCPGECEGLGVYPVHVEDLNLDACNTKDGTLVVVGQKDRNGNPMPYDDPYVFVRCPNCGGSGLKEPTDE